MPSEPNTANGSRERLEDDSSDVLPPPPLTEAVDANGSQKQKDEADDSVAAIGPSPPIPPSDGLISASFTGGGDADDGEAARNYAGDCKACDPANRFRSNVEIIEKPRQMVVLLATVMGASVLVSTRTEIEGTLRHDIIVSKYAGRVHDLNWKSTMPEGRTLGMLHAV